MQQTLIEAPRRAILEALKKEYHKDMPYPHVTELIYCLTRSFYERTQPIEPTDKEIMLFATGYGMQKLIIPGREVKGVCEGIHWSADQMEIVLAKPGELFRVGPDDDEELIRSQRTIVGELKCTRMSGSRFKSYEGELDPFQSELPEGWLRQVMAYCYANKTNVAHLIGFLLMGNYKPPFPDIKVVRWEFTYEELAVNWAWLHGRWQVLDDYLDDHAPEPTQYCMKWECPLLTKKATCRYQLLCQTHI